MNDLHVLHAFFVVLLHSSAKQPMVGASKTAEILWPAHEKTPAIANRGSWLVGPPGLEPGTKGLWAASRNKNLYKSTGYALSTGVWKQMWNQRLFISTKQRTVNQRFSRVKLRPLFRLIFLSRYTFCYTVTGLGVIRMFVIVQLLKVCRSLSSNTWHSPPPSFTKHIS